MFSKLTVSKTNTIQETTCPYSTLDCSTLSCIRPSRSKCTASCSPSLPRVPLLRAANRLHSLRRPSVIKINISVFFSPVKNCTCLKSMLFWFQMNEQGLNQLWSLQSPMWTLKRSIWTAGRCISTRVPATTRASRGEPSPRTRRACRQRACLCAATWATVARRLFSVRTKCRNLIKQNIFY